MATVEDLPRSSDEVRCSYHPGVMTHLRCSRCGKPICPRCGVRTPVGLRCPECAGVRGLPTYRTDSSVLAKSVAAGAGTALVVGVLWGYHPAWGFFLALVLGFVVAEAMARMAKAKRGTDLQVAGFAAVALGLVVSRAVLARRLHITWSETSAYSIFVQHAMHIRAIPDGLFAAIAFAVIWYRFR